MALGASSNLRQSAVVALSANPQVRERVIRALEACECSAFKAEGGAEVLAHLDDSNINFAVLDRRLPDLDTDEVMRFMREQNPDLSYVVLDSATGKLVGPHQLVDEQAQTIFEALRQTEGDRQSSEPARAQTTPAKFEPLPGMIGSSEASSQTHRMARIVSRRNSTVLLQGESGTGKDMIAYAIHQLSTRSSGPLVVVNCAAIPESLLESELFGYAKGAFTGAMQSRLGRIHAAHRGTLFLDEVGELPLSMQAKLLRFLQAGEVQRLGSTDVFQVDVRVIAATNANLQEKVAAGQFRADLYYRLAVFPIHLSPLRERNQEIVPLARHFLTELCRSNACPLKQFDDGALIALQEHNWPGNVRELKHAVERAFILSEDDAVITAGHIIVDKIQNKFRKVTCHLA